MTTMVEVKEVRERSGAPLADCKLALEETGNINAALEALQKRGVIKAAKKAGRIAADGVIRSYIHGNGRIGVLLEVNCETDFCDDCAMQIAGMSPQYVRTEEVPGEMQRKQEEIFTAQLQEEKKPEKSWPKILEGKMNKWRQEICLLTQEAVASPKKTIEQLRVELVAKIGENVQVRRFVRWEMGEGIEKAAKEDYAAEVASLAGISTTFLETKG